MISTSVSKVLFGLLYYTIFVYLYLETPSFKCVYTENMWPEFKKNIY